MNRNMSITVSAGLLIAAVAPALYLCFYIYRKDKIEKEPASLLKKLFFGGVWSAALAMVLEMGAQYLIDASISYHITMTAYAVMEATMVGIVEESCKFFFLKKRSWNNPNFNYRFDGIVYAVFVSLGFAAIENVLYVFNYGNWDIIIQRAILTIPAHMSFAVYMGYYYGMAKAAAIRGNDSLVRMNIAAGLVSAILLHAIYDGALMIGSDASLFFFVIFVVLLDIFVMTRIKKEARRDQRIY